jgi:hypothetical protein
MTVSIQQGENFCCQAFGDLRTEAFSDESKLAPRVWAGKGLPVIPGEHWERWLGELTFRSLRNSLVLTVTCPQSEKGHVVDEGLKSKLDCLTFGILLQGTPSYRESFLISGANESGEADARQFSRARVFYPSWKTKSLVVGRAELDCAIRLAARLESINLRGEDWRRLRRAIDCLTKGSAEPRYQEERLHQFVRCLEGLILPDQGSSTTQFVHRAQTFAVANEATKLALEQIYNVRGKVEHLHHPFDPLPGDTTDEKEKLLYWRVRQVDALARFVLRHVLESDALTAVFKTDESIDAFWHKPDHERTEVWGKRLDLESIS